MLQSQLTTKPPQLYSNKASQTLISSLLQLQLLARNDSAFVPSLNKKFKSLNSDQYLALVPFKVDRNFVYTIGLGMNPCPTCVNETRLVASLNNVPFVMPQIALLQAHYLNLKCAFRTNFSDRPPSLQQIRVFATVKNCCRRSKNCS
ncbi:hypothetical protein AHAS_Ahas15G0086900 [Arachis hypogaea]